MSWEINDSTQIGNPTSHDSRDPSHLNPQVDCMKFNFSAYAKLSAGKIHFQ